MEFSTLARLNQNQQIVMNSQDIITGWLSNKDPYSVITDDADYINIYNQWCEHYDLDDKILVSTENTDSDYISTRTDISNWNMPQEYKDMDMHQYLLTQLPNVNKISTEYKRMMSEYAMFEERGMIPVLKFLKYLVDTCKENNIVLGVGRGSSVASYILYLLGVHRVDSIKFNLDIKEFLK